MQDLLPVNLLIGDRTYRIRIKAEEEERIRKTAKALNEQMAQFKTQYPGKDMQDYMAMVLLSHVTEIQKPAQATEIQDFSISLGRIERMLDRALDDQGS